MKENNKVKTIIVTLLLIASSFSAGFSQEPLEKLVIVGAGPAGLTSAIYAAQAGLAPFVVEGNECEGQLTAVYHMENYPGFPEGINGAELVGRMRLQAEKFGTRFQSGTVIDIDLLHHPFRLTLSDGTTVYSGAVIIASGTSKRWIGLDSEEALKGKGIGDSATHEAPLFQGKEVVVVGGGDAALEEALVLAEYASKVTLIHRSDKLNASTYLQDAITASKKIHVILNTAIDDILDVLKGHVTGIVLRNLKTQVKSTLPCEGIFVSIGRQPNIDLFKEQLEITASGHIVVESPSTKTSIPGVFAAGDAIDPSYRKAITAAGLGCMAALDAIRFLNLETPIKSNHK